MEVEMFPGHELHSCEQFHWNGIQIQNAVNVNEDIDFVLTNESRQSRAYDGETIDAGLWRLVDFCCLHSAVQWELDVSAAFIQRYYDDIIITGLLQHIADHAGDAFRSAARGDVVDEESHIGLSHDVPPEDRNFVVFLLRFVFRNDVVLVYLWGCNVRNNVQ